MNYPDDARSMALLTAFHALVLTLHDAGLLDGERLLGHVAAGHRSLTDAGETVAASALQDAIEPLARRFGFEGRLDG